MEDLRRCCGSWSSKGPTQQTKKAALMEQLTGRRPSSGVSEAKRFVKYDSGLLGDRPSREVVNDDAEKGNLVHEG